ncbi:cyclase family protein [soil metagenome]
MIAPGWDMASVVAFGKLIEPLSNWGRWGSEDELGTLNLLGSAQRMAARDHVVEGDLLSLGRQVSTVPATGNPAPMLHLMKASGDAAADLGGSHASDWIGLACHGFAVTHLDALSHQFFNGRMYNGFPAAAVSTRTGAGRGSVERLAGGLVGRGVLIDAPRARGVGWLEPGEEITAAELDRALSLQHTSIQPGDLVLVRTGRDARARERGPTEPMLDGAAGLALDCLPWLRGHDVAVLGSDSNSELMASGCAPFATPIHVGALVFLGMPLLDNLLLEDLAQRCSELQRWQFCLTIAPLALHRSTGCAVNPLALL